MITKIAELIFRHFALFCNAEHKQFAPLPHLSVQMTRMFQDRPTQLEAGSKIFF